MATANKDLWNKSIKKEKDKKKSGRKQKAKQDELPSGFLFDPYSSTMPTIVDNCVDYIERNGKKYLIQF